MTGGEDKRVYYFDARTWKVIHVWKDHEATIHAVAFSADGKLGLSAGGDGTVRVRRLDNGAETACLRGHEGAVRSAQFLPGGKQVLSGGEDGTVRRWDLAGANQLDCWKEHAAPIIDLAVSQDGKRAYSLDETGLALSWDLEKGQRLKKAAELDDDFKTQGSFPQGGKYTLTGSRTNLKDSRLLGALSPDGKRLLLTAPYLVDMQGRRWNPGRPPSRFTPATTHSIFDIFLLPINIAGGILGNDSGQAPGWVPVNSKFRTAQFHVQDPSTGTLVKRYFGDPDANLTAVGVQDEGARILLGCDNGIIWFCNLSNKQSISLHHDDDPMRLAPRNRPDPNKASAIQCLAMSRNGRYLLVGHGGGKVRLWDLSKGTLLRN
jgi:WD40 repeat protein